MYTAPSRNETPKKVKVKPSAGKNGAFNGFFLEFFEAVKLKSGRSALDAAALRLQKEYEQVDEISGAGGWEDEKDEDLGDECLEEFHNELERCRDQVVRYALHGTPCHISEDASRSIKVPNCLSCGSERVFECQLMPALHKDLYDHRADKKRIHVKDWSTILIYVCPHECGENTFFEEAVCIEAL